MPVFLKLIYRLVQIIPTFLIVMVFIFLLVRLLPGDPAMAIADSKVTDEQLELIRRNMGLDQPLYVQFAIFVGNTLKGDLGRSIMLSQPVMNVIADHLPASLFLAAYSVVLAVLISVPLAFVCALNRNRLPDLVIRGLFQVGLSTPVFYVGLVLLTLLAAGLRWFPVGGYGESFASRLHHLMLPALTVAFYTAAIVLRNLRAAIIEVLDADYVQFPRANGIAPFRILTRHVLPNAMVSTVTLIGLSIGNLISGTLVTETVFAVPGVGRLMLEAIFARDYPLVQGLTLVFAVLVSLVFLTTDVIQSWLDPRLRLS